MVEKPLNVSCSKLQSSLKCFLWLQTILIWVFESAFHATITQSIVRLWCGRLPKTNDRWMEFSNFSNNLLNFWWCLSNNWRSGFDSDKWKVVHNIVKIFVVILIKLATYSFHSLKAVPQKCHREGHRAFSPTALPWIDVLCHAGFVKRTLPGFEHLQKNEFHMVLEWSIWSRKSLPSRLRTFSLFSWMEPSEFLNWFSCFRSHSPALCWITLKFKSRNCISIRSSTMGTNEKCLTYYFCTWRIPTRLAQI